MWNLIAAAEMNTTWYLLPLAVVISLVYNASRYEIPAVIVTRAVRTCITILVFMTAVFLVLFVLSFNL